MIMMQSNLFFAAILVAFIVVKASDESLADCGISRCVTGSINPIEISNECGVACSSEDACETEECAEAQYSDAEICGDGGICLRASYHIVLNDGVDPCTCSSTETSSCDAPRCVRVTNLYECGQPCSKEDACDTNDCISEQVDNETICGDGGVCIEGVFHMLLTQEADPCGCTSTETISIASDLASETQSCFSSTVTVQVEHKGTTFVKELQVGDKVLTGTHKYEPVYAVDHKNPNKVTTFVQIYSTANEESPLELTDDHMIFIHGKDGPIPASAIKVGDELRTVDDASPSTVTRVSSVKRAGIWNVITKDGAIVVNDIVASTYSVPFRKNDKAILEVAGLNIMSYHEFIHLLMTPYRFICLGLSHSFCETQNEFNAYSKMGNSIVKFVSVQNRFVQDTMFFLFLLIALMFKILSNAMHPSVATLIVVGIGAYYYRFMPNKKLQRK